MKSINLIDFIGLKINSPPYNIRFFVKLFLKKHERRWVLLNSCKIKNYVKLKNRRMKKIIILTFVILGFSFGSFAQTALINGINNPPNQNVCDGQTYTMTAGISTGFTLDSVEWYVSVNGASYVLESTATTIDAPIGGASVGDTCDYFLRVYYDGTGSFVSTIISLIPNQLPTITTVTPVDVCNDGTLLQVDVDGLSGPFPVDVKLYLDGYSSSDLIYTEMNVTTTSATIYVNLGVVASGNHNIYGIAENPVNGCASHQEN